MSDVKFLVVDVVQEHVDPREVVGREVDLLAEEAFANILFAKHFRKLEQQ